MKKYIIHGGKKIAGTVDISGSKNAALPILAAALLTDEDCILKNVPVLRDTQTMFSLLALLGKKVIVEDERVIIRQQKKGGYKATYDIVKQMRASIVVLGPLTAKYGKAHVSLPGGCAFGPRPVDLHLRGIEALGAKILFHHGYIDAKAKKLKGAQMNLVGEFGPSVLATDNVAMAATLAEGTTIIDSAAREPETVDLCGFLSAMGAKIEGAGSSSLIIHGVKKLHGAEYEIIPDRIEAGTFMFLSAMTQGKLKINYKRPDHLIRVTEILKKIGADIKTGKNFIQVNGKKPSLYKAFNVATLPYPEFPTDLQPLLMALGMLVPGACSITEKIYPNRWNHAPELGRMGADIRIEKETAIISKAKSLEGASVQASDLRAGAALVCAALAAKGESEVRRVYHIERGYSDFPEKLRALGADIKEAPDTLL